MQSRKWMLTINNPQKHNLGHDVISDKLMMSKPQYFCMCDEIGEEGTYHTHVFLYSLSPIRFETLKKRFPQAHLESCRGKIIEAVNYIRKQGRWADTDKSETNLNDTFEEYGKMPDEKQEKIPELAVVIKMLEENASTSEIIKAYPQFALRTSRINELRETLRTDKYIDTIRKLEVIYLYSETDVDLFSYILQYHLPCDVCRITNYGRNGHVNFDNYHGQSVLVFENFRSSIEIDEFLVYLSPYPCALPARYSDRSAAYNKVYIVSYIPLDRQYRHLEGDQNILLRKFQSKINKLIEFRVDGEVVETEMNFCD